MPARHGNGAAQRRRSERRIFLSPNFCEIWNLRPGVVNTCHAPSRERITNGVVVTVPLDALISKRARTLCPSPSGMVQIMFPVADYQNLRRPQSRFGLPD